MEKVNEKREFSIDYKIFNKDDLISLTKLFTKHSDEILYKSKEIRRIDLIHKELKESNIKESDLDTSYSKLEFTSADNIHYSMTFDDVSDLDNILTNNKIIEINLEFRERVFDSRFIIRIKHTYSKSSSGSSYVEVGGKDKMWVNETLRIVEDFILACKDQSKFLRKYGILIIPLTILISNLFLNNIIELIITRLHMFSKLVMTSITKDWLFVIIILTLFTALPVIFVYYRVLKLWPAVEIQTGKDFQQIENQKRNKLWIIASIIIIPAIISFLFRLF